MSGKICPTQFALGKVGTLKTYKETSRGNIMAYRKKPTESTMHILHWYKQLVAHERTLPG